MIGIPDKKVKYGRSSKVVHDQHDQTGSAIYEDSARILKGMAFVKALIKQCGPDPGDT